MGRFECLTKYRELAKTLYFPDPKFSHKHIRHCEQWYFIQSLLWKKVGFSPNVSLTVCGKLRMGQTHQGIS